MHLDTVEDIALLRGPRWAKGEHVHGVSGSDQRLRLPPHADIHVVMILDEDAD
jgi:hypothetical protein